MAMLNLHAMSPLGVTHVTSEPNGPLLTAVPSWLCILLAMVTDLTELFVGVQTSICRVDALSGVMGMLLMFPRLLLRTQSA